MNEPFRATRQQRFVALGLTCLMSFISTLDITIVIVAFDDMRDAFGASSASLSWVITAYTIVAAALLVTSGRTTDRLGARSTFLAGVVLFTIGSALCSVGFAVWFIVAARIVQAAGSALQAPASLAIISEYFHENRSSAVGIWGMTSGLGSASGPLVGALLIEHLGWRWVFIVNVPIGILTAVIGLKMLRQMPGRDNAHRPDYWGSGLIMASVGGATFALVQTEQWGWSDARVWTSLACALAAFGILIWRSLNIASPTLDLSLYRIRSFRYANVISVVFPIGFFVQFFGLLSYFRVVWGDTDLRASARMTLPSVISAALTVVAGRVADRYGHRAAMVPGTVLYALGALWLFLFLDTPEPSAFAFWPGGVLLGAGVGFTYSCFNSAAVHDLPPDRYGAGGAMNLTINRVGGTIGVAVAVALLGTSPSVGTYRNLWLVMLITGAFSVVWAAKIDTRRPKPLITTIVEPREHPDALHTPTL